MSVPKPSGHTCTPSAFDGGQLLVDRGLLTQHPVGAVLLGVAVHVHRAVSHHQDDLDRPAGDGGVAVLDGLEVAHRLAERGGVIGVITLRLAAAVQLATHDAR